MNNLAISNTAAILDHRLTDLDDEDIRQLKQAVHQHGIVVLKAQTASAAEFVRFGRRIGEICPYYEEMYRHPEHEEVFVSIHGWSARAIDFTAFVEPLVDAGFRVLAFDNPGHGDSGGDTATLLDILAILLAVQERIGPADTVIGHSLGVLQAFYALNHGVFASHLVALSGVSDFSYLVAHYTAAMQLGDETAGLLRHQLEQMFGRATIWEEFSSHNNLSGLRARVSLIHDAGDNFIELSQSEKLAAALGDRASLHVTLGLGHRHILAELAVVSHVLNKIGSQLAPASPARAGMAEKEQ